MTDGAFSVDPQLNADAVTARSGITAGTQLALKADLDLT
jgi:hypothetical protein